jgi:hypothetical protein
MNTGNIEIAFANALQQAVPTLTVLKMRDGDEIPPDQSFAVVGVDRCEHVAGNLWKATVTVSVMSPAPLLTEIQHNAAVAQVVAFVEGSLFYTSYNAQTGSLGHVCAGGKLLYAEGEPEGNNYKHNLSILLGLSTS